MSERLRAAVECGNAMIEAEVKADEMLAAVGELITKMARGRITAGISAVSGQELFERAIQSAALGVQMRSVLVDTHNGLEAFRRLHRIERPTLGGPTDKPPQDTQPGFMSAPLRVVANEVETQAA